MRASPFDKDLQGLLDAHRPRSVLVIGPLEVEDLDDPSPRRITRMGQDELPKHLDGLGRYDLGIVVGTIEHMTRADAGRLIARLRDLHTRCFYVLVPTGPQWTSLTSTWEPGDMIAFGMTPAGHYEQDGKPLRLYKFDISDYKKTPDWLNPTHWANPRLWGKYRW